MTSVWRPLELAAPVGTAASTTGPEGCPTAVICGKPLPPPSPTGLLVTPGWEPSLVAVASGVLVASLTGQTVVYKAMVSVVT